MEQMLVDSGPSTSDKSLEKFAKPVKVQTTRNTLTHNTEHSMHTFKFAKRVKVSDHS